MAQMCVGALRCVALVGCTIHEAHLAAAAALAACDAIQPVSPGCTSRAAVRRPQRWQLCCRPSAAREQACLMPGAAVQGVVRTERQPSETADAVVVDPAPPGHIIQVIWGRLPEDNQESAELQTRTRRRLIPCQPQFQSSASWTRRSWRVPACVGSTWGSLVTTTCGGSSGPSRRQHCPTPGHAGRRPGLDGRGLH